MDSTVFEEIRYRSDDGLSLYARLYGNPATAASTTVCLPGLSRNSRDFQPFAALLVSQGHTVLLLDYRGRGLSDWDATKANYNIVREAQDVLAALDHVGIARANFVGTSRGGLIIHILAGMVPQRIDKLVLNDIGPVIEADGLKEIRDYLSVRASPSSFEEAAKLQKATHGARFPSLSDADWLEMAYALYRDIDGNVLPDFDPALVEPLKAMDFSKPLPDMWAQYDALAAFPLMIVRGDHSTLLSLETTNEMLRRHSGARLLTAIGQGHAPLLHLSGVAEPITEFLG